MTQKKNGNSHNDRDSNEHRQKKTQHCSRKTVDIQDSTDTPCYS